MKKQFFEKWKEAVSAVTPVVLIVLALCITVIPTDLNFILLFLLGAVLLIIGMIFFTLGADISMIRIGQAVGSHITKSRKIPFIAIVCFVLGVIITIAEPDLRVLANSVPVVDTGVMIIAVAVGVGIFLVISFFRVYLQIKLSYILIVMYALVFGLALSPLIPNDFVAAAFDSGGVTTGPITVPFIMALGVGLASVRGDKTSIEDSFGLVALCSVGPILTMMILGALNDTSGVSASAATVPQYDTVSKMIQAYLTAFPHYTEEVALALLPIILVFLLLQVVSLRLDRHELLKIGVGMVYTFCFLFRSPVQQHF